MQEFRPNFLNGLDKNSATRAKFSSLRSPLDSSNRKEIPTRIAPIFQRRRSAINSSRRGAARAQVAPGEEEESWKTLRGSPIAFVQP